MTNRLLLIASLPLAWFACALLWWAPHTFAEVYVQMGAALPYPTDWIVRLSASGAPLLAGAVYTLATLWALLRPAPRRTWLVPVLCVLLTVWLAVALGALAIPFQKCGFHWPDLPWQTGATPCCSLD